MNSEFEIEDIEIDQFVVEKSFQYNYKKRKFEYISDLEQYALKDYDLEKDKLLITKSFQNFRAQMPFADSSKLSFREFLILGKFPERFMRQMSYLVVQLDNLSPVPVMGKSSAVNSTGGVRKKNFLGLNLQKHSSNQSEDNYYDDDFEEYNPEHDAIAEEITDEEEDRKRELFFNDNNLKPDSEHRNNRQENGRFTSGPIYPKRVDSSLSNEDIVPRFPTRYQTSSSEIDPVQNKLPPSAESVAFSQQSRRRQRNPSWIGKRNWKLGEKIGSGSFGEVFQAMNDKGKLFAAKRMNVIDKSMEVDNLLSEIQLMRGLSHKHIVEYLGAFVDTEACYLYIFQEWVPGGSVASLLKKFGPFSPSVVKNYTRQILLGLQYLHSNGIIHRDIKGGNILVDDAGIVKLADFGASTKLSQFDKTQETTTIKGTPYFMAPEVLSASRYGRKGDIWAVGCTMIQMLTGEPPWKDRNLKGLIQLHLLLSSWNQGPPPYNCELSIDGKQCLELCFRKDENERPTASELLQCNFLRDDDLEDSHNSSFNGRSGRGFGDSQRDMLEDSGILTGLKQEINKAVTKSMAGLPPYRAGTEDTMQMIDRKIAERQGIGSNNPSKQFSVAPNNPFASRTPTDTTNSLVSPDGEISVQGLLEKLPSSTFADVRAPKQSREPAGPFPAPLSLQPVGSNIGSTGTTPISAQSQNPFSKGIIAIKNNQPQTQTPIGSGLPNSARSEVETQKLHNIPPSNSTPRSTQIPLSHPQMIDDNRNINVRDSLHAIKKRANEKAQQNSSGNRRNSNSASLVNQSSNRDSEELTPLPLEDESDYYYRDARGSPSQKGKTLHRDDSKYLFDTRYYEEKRRNVSDDAEDKHSVSGSLSAASSVPLAETSLPKGSLDRGISVESVADDVGDNYSKDITNSREDTTPNTSNPLQSEELKFMHSSTEFQFNKIGDKSRKYYPSKYPEVQDEDSKQINAHDVIMRKSSSVNEVRFQSNRSSPVPRLSNLDSNQSRQADKYVSSASARIARTDPVVEPATRPYSSKASFVYNDSKTSKSNSATQSPESTEPADRRSLSQGSNPFGRSAINVSRSQESSAGWYCGKCNTLNVPGIQFCEKCATRKGITGDRKNDSVVPRFN